ncbi:MAG: ATP-binding protein [Fibrobacteria bacterium]
MDALSPGFFLLHPDGWATSAGIGDAARIPLASLLPLNPEQETQFGKWLKLVAQRHRDLRWDKLAALAPLQEIRGLKGDEENRLHLTYHKLTDAGGDLSAIAVSVSEAAPSRAMTMRLEEERLRHKLEIRDVLALAANPPETVGTFLDDARLRLEAARWEWEGFLAGQKSEGKPDANPWERPPTAEESVGQHLFRELHMIKGNAGAFGFESLAAGAQESEELLEGLKQAGAGAERTRAKLSAALTGLRSQLEELLRAMKLIAGEGEEATTRILKWKLDRLTAAAAGMDTAKLDPALQGLIEATARLAFLSPAYLLRKYGNLVERLAQSLGKRVAFRVASNTGDVHPESFARVDEALVHILRNMVDHGIETPAVRKAMGKGEAEIGIEYVAEEDRIFLRIRDNGRGMDPGVIADRGVQLGMLTRAEADSLDDLGKLGLIFVERFTTRDRADQVSGRGLGLALAHRCVNDRGGNLYVYSRPGEGTRFAIELPHLGHKRLPQ